MFSIRAPVKRVENGRGVFFAPESSGIRGGDRKPSGKTAVRGGEEWAKSPPKVSSLNSTRVDASDRKYRKKSINIFLNVYTSDSPRPYE